MKVKSKISRQSKTGQPNKLKYILLGMSDQLRERLGKSRSVVCHQESDIRNLMDRVNKDSLWISPESEQTDLLLRSICNNSGRIMGSLYLLQKPRPNTLPFLHSYFGMVIGESPSYKSLPIDQAIEVMSLPHEESQDLFIGGTLDQKNKLLSLVCGDRRRITVPLEIFKPSGKSRPEFAHFSIGEYGHSVVFGDYEASAAFILGSVDPDYRKRINIKRREEDKGFGPSLRRLRIQKRLKRSDFGEIDSKTIARIERGEVSNPHGRTLATICEVLGVNPSEIETY